MALELEELTNEVIAAAIAVQRELGAGFVESIYESALCIELECRGVEYRRQMPIIIEYRGRPVGEHILDLFVENTLVVELKAVKAFEDVHAAYTRSYVKAVKRKHGLLLNFNVVPMGIKRVIYDPNFRLRSQDDGTIISDS